MQHWLEVVGVVVVVVVVVVVLAIVTVIVMLVVVMTILADTHWLTEFCVRTYKSWFSTFISSIFKVVPCLWPGGAPHAAQTTPHLPHAEPAGHRRHPCDGRGESQGWDVLQRPPGETSTPPTRGHCWLLQSLAWWTNDVNISTSIVARQILTFRCCQVHNGSNVLCLGSRYDFNTQFCWAIHAKQVIIDRYTGAAVLSIHLIMFTITITFNLVDITK